MKVTIHHVFLLNSEPFNSTPCSGSLFKTMISKSLNIFLISVNSYLQKSYG